jgi:hypothetical protein
MANKAAFTGRIHSFCQLVRSVWLMDLFSSWVTVGGGDPRQDKMVPPSLLSSNYVLRNLSKILGFYINK